MDLNQEINILKDNIQELQKQLSQAHQRIGELVSEKSVSNEEVIQQITGQLQRVNLEAEQKIQQQMDSIPDVLDSKQMLKEGK